MPFKGQSVTSVGNLNRRIILYFFFYFGEKSGPLLEKWMTAQVNPLLTETSNSSLEMEDANDHTYMAGQR